MAREGECVKHESLEQTVRYWVGQDKQRRYLWKKTGKRFSLTRGRVLIHEVLQKDSYSSMYKVYDYIIVLGRRRIACRDLSAVCCDDYLCSYFWSSLTNSIPIIYWLFRVTYRINIVIHPTFMHISFTRRNHSVKDRIDTISGYT
jgi:hypothetical protein